MRASPPQCARPQAWLTNFVGRKRFVLFHPGHRHLVEDEQGFMDVDAPDDARFPRWREAPRVEAEVGPGDVIYIPRRWPHHVRSLDDTLSLTVNFCARCNAAAVLEHAVRYAARRGACEALLGRPLRAADNLLKFCTHGGEVNLRQAAAVMGVPLERLAELLAARRQGSTDDAGGDDDNSSIEDT